MGNFPSGPLKFPGCLVCFLFHTFLCKWYRLRFCWKNKWHANSAQVITDLRENKDLSEGINYCLICSFKEICGYLKTQEHRENKSRQSPLIDAYIRLPQGGRCRLDPVWILVTTILVSSLDSRVPSLPEAVQVVGTTKLALNSQCCHYGFCLTCLCVSFLVGNLGIPVIASTSQGCRRIN